MKYVNLNIEGWLSGTVARYLSKSEKAVWSNLIVLGGKGKGRIGYIEFEKHVPYTRGQLLVLCDCYSEEDVMAFDSCFDKCIKGIDEGEVNLDKPRLVKDKYGCFEIINWDSYQNSGYPKGFTEDEIKEQRKNDKAERQQDKPVHTQIGDKAHELNLLTTMGEKNPDVVVELARQIEEKQALGKTINQVHDDGHYDGINDEQER